MNNALNSVDNMFVNLYQKQQNQTTIKTVRANLSNFKYGIFLTH